MQKEKFRPYRSKLRNVFVVYAMTLIIIFVAIIVIFLFTSEYMWVEKRNRDNNIKVASRLEANILEYENIILEYSQSDIILEAIRQENNRNKAYELVYDFVNRQDIKCNFYFFDGAGAMVMSNTKNPPDYINESIKIDWGVFKRMRMNPDNVHIYINRVYSPLNKYSIFTLGKTIISDGSIQGYVIFELLENDVFSIISNFSSNDTVITDKYFNVASATSNNYTDNFTKLKNEYRSTTGKFQTNGVKFYLYRNGILNDNFYVYTFTQLNYYERIFIIGGIFFAVLCSIITIVMVMWAKRLSDKKTQVITEIMEAITSVQNGNLDVKLKINSNDEFQIIAQAYNKMVTDIKNLIKQNNEETQRSMIAEIKQLESQFNPHFLFNTLETIRCMVKLNPNEVNNIIVNLSALLRYSINNTIKTVPFREDIEYTKNYLEILKYRFKNMLEYEISIEEDALDCIIPKLLIQPLIENAVKHGFEGKNHLTVKIKARFFGDQLVIVIYDDGAGISQDMVTKIKAMLRDDSNNTINIGLYNVNRRLQLMYGKECSLEIMSEEDAGTTVKILIPVNQ